MEKAQYSLMVPCSLCVFSFGSKGFLRNSFSQITACSLAALGNFLNCLENLGEYLISFMILSTFFFTEEGMDIVIIFLMLPLYYNVIQTSRKKRLVPYATGRN